MIALRVAIVSLVLVPIAWMAAASALLCYFLGRVDLYRFPFLQWAQTAPWWRTGWRLAAALVGSAAIPTVVMLVLCIVVWRATSVRRKRRQPNLYGATGWANPDEIARGGLKIDRETF